MQDPAQSQPSPDEMETQDNPQEEATEAKNGPLESMSIDPAENGGVIVTHHPKVKSDRVRAMGHEAHKPRKHVFKTSTEAAAHIAKHIHRVKS